MKAMWKTPLAARRAAIGAGLALALTACGDDAVTPAADVPLFDVGGGGFPDVPLQDATPPADAATAADAVADAALPRDTAAPDLVPDTTPPSITSSNPAAGGNAVALPLTITLNFSEPLFRNTVTVQTIKLLDSNSAEIPVTVTLEANESTVIVRPVTHNQALATPYLVRILGGNPAISDKAGNRIVNNIDIPFTTANYPNQDALQAVAERYAPTIFSAVKDKSLPQSQIPAKADADGNWDLSNTRAWLRTTATSVIPAVYWSVAETYTHYFVTYQYFFPDVNHSTAIRQHGNGTRGLVVTVEKARAGQPERPIAANLYWPSGTTETALNEEQVTFITTESGLGAVQHRDDAKPQATLFPENRFESFITAQDHNHCSRRVQRQVALQCGEDYSTYAGDMLVFKFLGSVTPVTSTGSARVFPSNMTEANKEAFGYALIPLSSTLWMKRFEVGGDRVFQSLRFTYKGRDADHGDGLSLTAKFVEPVGANTAAFGKPVWAWRWKPSVGPGAGTFLNEGALGLDPAAYFFARHNPENQASSPLKPYDATSGAGFSQSYCFNLMLNIDRRTTDPKCAAPAAQ